MKSDRSEYDTDCARTSNSELRARRELNGRFRTGDYLSDNKRVRSHTHFFRFAKILFPSLIHWCGHKHLSCVACGRLLSIPIGVCFVCVRSSSVVSFNTFFICYCYGFIVACDSA